MREKYGFSFHDVIIEVYFFSGNIPSSLDWMARKGLLAES